MARIRTIKPELPQSESMGRVSRDARLTFIQLFTLADDSGRLRGNSRMLASLLFPYDDDVPILISGWLDELEREGCIVRYVDASGSSYIQIRNWLDHQKIDKPSPSKLPAPDSAKVPEYSRGLDEGSRKIALDQGSRTKEGIKDQGLDHGKDREGSVGEGSKDGAGAQLNARKFHPPTLDELREFCRDYPSVDPEEFHNMYSAQGWKLSNGRSMVDWQAAVKKWSANAAKADRKGPTTFAQQRLANSSQAIKEFAGG